MSQVERHFSGNETKLDSNLWPTQDDPEANLFAARKKLIRKHKSGRCTLARRRLNAVFSMRKYYVAVMGIAGIEAFLVICRLLLETEALRHPPGTTQNTIIDTQLALFCIAIPIHLLFVLEQPFKWWALGSNRFCKSVLIVLDALVCIACFSLNVYCVHELVNRRTVEMLSLRQVTLCGSTHFTYPANTAWTFAIVAGIIIIYRLWCIQGYIDKSIKKATTETASKLSVVQRAREDSESRVAQLEAILREQSMQKASRGSMRMGPNSSSNTRSSSRRSTQHSKFSSSPPNSGEPV